MTAVSFFVAIIFTYFYYTKDTRAFESILKSQPVSASRYFSEDGVLIAEEYDTHRIYVSYNNIPEYLKLAFISAEDKSFYNHPGFDFKSIVRATSQNIYNYLFLRDNSRLIGASTITQQLIKNLLNDNKRTISRKIKEIMLAVKLERVLSKEKILELYLNEIYLGRGAFGVVAASEKYFGKTLNHLDVEEMALLAALPKAPSNYDPQENYEAIKERRDWVLERMAENGVITRVVSQIMQESPINYENANSYTKPNLLSKSIRDRARGERYFDDNTTTNDGLTYFLTTNQNATDYVNDQINQLNEIHGNNNLHVDIKALSLISGRTLVDTQNGHTDTNILEINTDGRSILRPIYYAGIINSGVDLNRKLLSSQQSSTDTEIGLITVRELFRSNGTLYDESLKANASEYLLGYLKDITRSGSRTINSEEKVGLNLDQVIDLFTPILSDGSLLDIRYLDKIDDMNGNQIFLHKDRDVESYLDRKIAFKVKTLLCDLDKIEIGKNKKYMAQSNCVFTSLNGDKLFYLKFTANVAFFAIINGVNLQNEKDLISIMDNIANGSFNILDQARLKNFLIPDDINAYKINKNTGNRYNYKDDYVWEFF
tara:strand:+ start:116 stop:1912 length:1797 start_codon:yes stop_codon:yes gene_type:complete